MNNTTSDELSREFEDCRVIFCGITRDNEMEMPAVLESIEETGNLFGDYCVVVYENDSSDGTLQLLEDWKKRLDKNVTIISETHGLQKRPDLQFLAFCRNKYLQEINKEIFDDYTYVVMVDFDMKFGWSVSGVANSFQQKNWDVIAANGISTTAGNMWDAFSFRTEELNEPYDSEKYGPIGNYWPILHTSQYHRIFPPGTPMVPVRSAFGGLCIYKKDMLKGLAYNLESEDCEHVSLHDAIRGKGGRIYMNPSMLIRYNNFRIVFQPTPAMTDKSKTLCRLCEGNLSVYGERQILGRYDIKYYKCSVCGSLQTEYPYWLDEAYAVDSPHLDIGACERNIQLVMQCDGLFSIIQLGRENKFLDYGGGNGMFSRMMRDRGYNFRCYDKYADSHYAYGFVEENVSESSASIITAFEVFEHLPDPKLDLGLLFAKNPNIILFTTELFSGQDIDWRHLAPLAGQHVFFYSSIAMDMLAGNQYEFFDFGFLKGFLKKEFLLNLKSAGIDLRQVHSRIVQEPAGWLNHCLTVFAGHSKNPWQHVEKDHRYVSDFVNENRGNNSG